MNCAYCYEENKHSAYASITQTLHMLKLIYQSDASPHEIEIFGGEPLLNWKAFLTILHYCSDKRTPMTTSTNGLLLTPDKILTLTHYNISVGISYDGRTAHDIYRRTLHNECTEQLVRDAILRSLANNLHIVINMAFHVANARYILDDIKDLYDLGITRVKLHTVNHNMYSVPFNERSHVFDSVLRFASDTGMQVYLSKSLQTARVEHKYYTGDRVKTQQKGTLGHWATVGWE